MELGTWNAEDVDAAPLYTEFWAGVVKLADAPDSKSGGLNARVGSIPSSGTIYLNAKRAANDEVPRHAARLKAWAYSVNRKIGYARSDDTHAYEDARAILRPRPFALQLIQRSDRLRSSREPRCDDPPAAGSTTDLGSRSHHRCARP